MDHYIEDDKGQVVRKATPEEVQAAQEHFGKINSLQELIWNLEEELASLYTLGKKFKVTYDEPGYVYDVRHYVATGETDLI